MGGHVLEVLIAAAIIFAIVGLFSENGCLGCGIPILLGILFFAGIGLGAKSTTEDHKGVVYTTHLVALSDSVGTSGEFFLGSGSVGSVPTYFYSYRTEKGIVQEILQKETYPIYIVEENTNLPRLERRLESNRVFRKSDGRWDKVVYWAFGAGHDWHENPWTTEYYFIVPKGSVRVSTDIDTR